jgi:hypothetical protein
LHLSAHTLSEQAPLALATSPSGDSEALLELMPLGDFEATPAALTSPPLRPQEPGELPLPQGTRALAAHIEDDVGARFLGYVERHSSPELALLLWPEARACRLDTEPASRELAQQGAAIGYSPEAQLVLVAGGGAPDFAPDSVAVRSFDAGTGKFTFLSAAESPSERVALAEPRAFATITPFGPRLLIAGGENPLRGESAALAPPSGTAEIFDPASGRFDGVRIPLTLERSRHAAVTLSTGETLLVGGRGPRGTALNTLEVVSPRTGSASIAGLASLMVPRLFAAVLPLDDQRLFIGGGTGADGTPLAALEWLSADARTRLKTVVPGNFSRRHERAFAALPGGGVLAVGGCEDSEVACDSDCLTGCPPVDPSSSTGAVRYDAFWIAPDGEVTELEFPFAAPRPVLMGGDDGMPLLATGSSSDPTLYRFNPWQSRFEPASVTMPVPPRAGAASTSLDAQAFVWLAPTDDGVRLFGARWGTRDHFAIDPPMVSGPSIDFMPPPLPLVPDRPPGDGARYIADSKIVAFAADSTVTAYIAAADYADFAVDLWVEGQAPRLVLGDAELGSESCPWPPGADVTYRLERSGETVVLSSGERRSAPCVGPKGRVRFGVRGGDGEMVVRRISVERRPQ